MAKSINAADDRVMSPLNFVVKLKPGAKAGIEKVNPIMEATLKKGADAIGTLHEARFIRYDDETILVFTIYDGTLPVSRNFLLSVREPGAARGARPPCQWRRGGFAAGIHRRR